MRTLVFFILVITIGGCTSPDQAAIGDNTSTAAVDLSTTSNSPTIAKPPTPTVKPAYATPTVVVAPTHEETETSIASATQQPMPAVTEEVQAPPDQAYEYVTLAEQSFEHYAEFVAWEPDGRRLVYALHKERGADTVRRIGPDNWEWWRYDPESEQSTPLPSPESSISMEVWRKLGICAPQPLNGDECGKEPIMWESPYGDWVIYNPVPGGETTWLARKDGSNATTLEGVISSAQNAHWSSDGRWVLVSTWSGSGAPGMELHFLVDLNTRTTRQLGLQTGHTLTFSSFLRPQFSPNSRYLVYAATGNQDYKLRDGYGLYLMDMNTLESERLTDLYGPFQWAPDSRGLFVFDNAIDFEFAETSMASRKAALYRIDVSSRPFQETVLFDNIDFYPNENPSAWHWSYSPERQAIAYVGLQPENELGVLFLSPR